MENNLKKTCFDCGDIITDDTLTTHPDTEICGECLFIDSENEDQWCRGMKNQMTLWQSA